MGQNDEYLIGGRRSDLGAATRESLIALGHDATWLTSAGDALSALRVLHSFDDVLVDRRLGHESGESISRSYSCSKLDIRRLSFFRSSTQRC